MIVLTVLSKIRHTSKNVFAFMCVSGVCLKCMRDSEWVYNKSQIARLSPSIVWTVLKLLNVFFCAVSVCQISIRHHMFLSFCFNSETPSKSSLKTRLLDIFNPQKARFWPLTNVRLSGVSGWAIKHLQFFISRIIFHRVTVKPGPHEGGPFTQQVCAEQGTV